MNMVLQKLIYKATCKNSSVYLCNENLGLFLFTPLNPSDTFLYRGIKSANMKGSLICS